MVPGSFPAGDHIATDANWGWDLPSGLQTSAFWSASQQAYWYPGEPVDRLGSEENSITVRVLAPPPTGGLPPMAADHPSMDMNVPEGEAEGWKGIAAPESS
jgi:hypothetical protein